MEDMIYTNLNNLNYFQLSMHLISGMLFIYSLVISVRIILSWVRLGHTSRFAEILGKVVDPYLNLFRGIPFLRIGALDFSPILGITLIYFLMSITSQLALTGYISGWAVLILVIEAFWSVAGFLLSFLIIVFLVRLITTQIQSIRNHPFLTSFDQMIYSISSGILGLFIRKPVSFVKAMITTMIILLAVRLLGEVGIRQLILFLKGIAANAAV